MATEMAPTFATLILEYLEENLNEIIAINRIYKTILKKKKRTI